MKELRLDKRTKKEEEYNGWSMKRESLTGGGKVTLSYNFPEELGKKKEKEGVHM